MAIFKYKKNDDRLKEVDSQVSGRYLRYVFVHIYRMH